MFPGHNIILQEINKTVIRQILVTLEKKKYTFK